MIASGEICDANTLAAFARLTALGLVEGKDERAIRRGFVRAQALF